MRPLSLASGSNGDKAIPSDALEPIAIVGLATRFPQQATTTESLWELLLQARSTWSSIPKERFNSDAFYHPDPEHGGTFHVQGGHYLSEDPAYFDGSFFNITKNELLTLDPQQRLVLENVYHALENAGIPLTSAVGSNTSVFVSGFNHDYLGILNSDPETTLKYKPTGVTNAILSNRVSWFFDFKGPSMTIDTACSSSLVALHLAVQSLRARETNMAVVSGVSILENPVEPIGMSHHGLLGPQGRSFSFDSRAEGYARGEGVGTVVVKPLGAAIRDGDTIRAVIRETAVNQDGRTPGITVPSADAQERLIREVYWRAGLDLEQTRFVEAHGTGTSTGDPIEAGALARAFKCRRDTPLYIGAIKSSIGHLEGGSGVASIIKSILTLESGIIPANFDMKQTNPSIPAADWDIAFPTEALPWPSPGLRRVSVNSFGIGGTNAHCILDDAYHYLNDRRLTCDHRTTSTVPTTQKIKSRLLALSRSGNESNDIVTDSLDDSDHSGQGNTFVDTPTSDGFCASPIFTTLTYTSLVEKPKVLLLSAFDEDGLKRNAAEFAEYLKRRMTQSVLHGHLLDDLSFTLSKKRTQFPWKSFVMASSVKELTWNLSESNFAKPTRTTRVPEVEFVFTGQGAQYQAMGRELMVYPVFQESVEEASDYIRRLGNELLTERQTPRVNLPEIAHPLCTALQIALVDLLASWKIFPKRVMGHSSGEIAAAYCSGKLSREGAWKVAYYRGYVSSKQLSADGAMMAVGLGGSQLQPYLDSVKKDNTGELIIACCNSPKNNTVSGDDAMIDCLKNLLDADSIFARKLNVKNAYHSAHMHAISQDYLRLMGTLPYGRRLAAPHPVHMFSTVTGQQVKEEHLPAEYWVDNMVSPVLFTSGLVTMTSRPITSHDSTDSLRLIVEIGPHSTLQSAIKETLASNSPKLEFKYLAVLKRTDHSLNTLLTTVGFLASSGYELDIHAVNQASHCKARRRPRLLVDLPPYSFKHTEKVLFESRLSKNLRTRKFPRHDLFGAPITDWNPTAPRWRHFVRLNENPWLRDHMVTGNYVYPGVGYLIMVIEASRQLAGETKVAGFQLRKVNIRRALIVPDTKEGIEVSLAMASVEDSSASSRTWRRFQITSYNASSDEWTEHCTGHITVDHETASDPVDNGCEAEEESRARGSELSRANETCAKSLAFKSTYNNLQTSGLNFGPLFRNLTDVRASGRGLGMVVGSVTVPDIAQSMPKQYLHPHLIHPATMDSMIHLMIAAVLDFTNKSTLDQIRLPTFIRDVWVSADLNSAPNHKFTGHATVSMVGSDKFQGQIQMLDEETKTHRICMEGIELTPLESGLAENSERKLCSAIEYKPDFHLLDSKSACAVTPLNATDDTEALYWVKRLQLATMLYVVDALDELKDIDVMKLDLHMRRFFDWMEHMKGLLERNQIIHLPYSEYQEAFQDESFKEAIGNEIEAHSAEGAITARMGRNIAQVVRQETDPLHLMFGQDAVMEQVYKEGLHLYNLPRHLQSHLSLLRHQHSELNILEIGGGTGSFTAEVLAVLSPDLMKSKGNIASYTFTDISSGFFEKAKQRFQPWSDIMNFQSLNIERSPVDQGLQLGTYDLIFAGNVVHATANLQNALQNLRSLLKPGGQLIMQEGIRQDFLWYPLVFGQLPGWWLGDEPCRQWCPYIPATEWNPLLVKAGFSGIDVEYPSSNDPDLTWQSILVSSAIETPKEVSSKIAVILTLGTSKAGQVIESLQDLLPDLGYTSVLVKEPAEVEISILSDALCISLIDLESPYLFHMNEAEYSTLKKMLSECQNLLWVTCDPQTQPHASMSLGLLRTVRWERDADGSNIVTLTEAEPDITSPKSLATAVGKIIKRQFVDKPENDRHAEYMLQKDLIHIGRLNEWEAADQFLASQSSQQAPRLQRLGNYDAPIELQEAVVSTGEHNWIIDTQHEEPHKDTEVDIEIRAIGLSSDVSAGRLANEIAGVVSKVGPKVEGPALGDRVIYISGDKKGGCVRTHGRANQLQLVRIPDEISFEVAAGLAWAYATAIQGLGEIAHLAAKNTILIHTSATEISQAAIQYAQMIGATIYATVGTAEERDLLVSEYSISPDRIFSRRDLSFVKGIMRCTQNIGVDVVFNALSGEALRGSMACLAPFGAFIDVSNYDLRADTTVELSSLPRNVSVHTVDIPLLAQHRPKSVRLLLTEALRLYSEGKIGQLRTTTVLDFTQIKDGIRAVQSGEVTKVVIVPNPSNMVPVVPRPLQQCQFDPHASYVLAGGYGGLGRSLARWMASHGAKTLIILSRSSVSSPEKMELIADLERMGCKVHSLVCDVADVSSLQRLSGEAFSHLPAIKGCIQASMVLRDGAFAGLSFEDWQAAIRPKVHGSWNLHTVLPDNMDFFIMLSSVAGIFGNRGQSNYAAGNTFQDALAAYRVSKGMHAASINLGSVSNVGWVAENRSSMRTHTATLFELLREEEVHATVDFLILDKQDGGNVSSRSQLVLGLPTAEMCRQNGVPLPTYLNYSMFTHFRSTATAKSSEVSQQKTVSTAALLSAASGFEGAVAVVSDGIVERLASLLAIPSSELDAQRFGFGGIDSLVAMEFRAWIVKELKAEVSLLDIMGAENIRALSEKIAGRSRLVVGGSGSGSS
ncbi:Acyl transferase/acyl hydrolase/lysophospholipase [Penicillium italicum]|uniref:Acyl transferase/acyl hydrolase/lysophospholipase n=1 Tax=Penicillium italicum TaxID=40296 RepID=A0A0A2L3X4_PENIT|nr:Acyl transferase/acyl hydrolase/lysophospholipase [Penicillium italicum]